ncbi:MAG TPA: PepSY-associated TM helix domain-containing protein [Gemmatimonadaceae bacterium]
MSPRSRARIASVHRWLAVALSPVILLIILTGAVLAFRPILRPPSDHPTAIHRDIPRLIALLQLKEANEKAFFVGFPTAGDTVMIAGGNSEPKTWDLATGLAVPMPAQVRREPDVFDIAERVHKDLWFGLGGLVTLGSIALLFLVIAGPLLARPTRGGGPLGRHIRWGWWVWPLVAAMPLSLAMMKIHGGAFGSPRQPVTTLAASIRIASRSADLTRLEGMQLLPNGRAFFVLQDADGPRKYFLSDGQVRPLDWGVSRFGHALHTGAWGGRWGALLNLAAAAAMLWMLWSGLTSFLTRRARGRRRPAGDPTPA